MKSKANNKKPDHIIIEIEDDLDEIEQKNEIKTLVLTLLLLFALIYTVNILQDGTKQRSLLAGRLGEKKELPSSWGLYHGSVPIDQIGGREMVETVARTINEAANDLNPGQVQTFDRGTIHIKMMRGTRASVEGKNLVIRNCVGGVGEGPPIQSVGRPSGGRPSPCRCPKCDACRCGPFCRGPCACGASHSNGDGGASRSNRVNLADVTVGDETAAVGGCCWEICRECKAGNAGAVM